MLDNQHAEPDYPTQPPLLSFKQFLSQQDDNISDEDAIRNYAEYKTEFKKVKIVLLINLFLLFNYTFIHLIILMKLSLNKFNKSHKVTLFEYLQFKRKST